jgi:hypothetical protein
MSSEAVVTGPALTGVTIDTAAPAAAPDTVQRAGDLERAGKLDEAMACVERILAATPDNAEAVHLKGVLTYREGRIADAVELMERSIELGAQPHFLRNICEAYRLLGRYDDALAAGRRAVKLNPQDAIAHANLSVLHYERAEPADAAATARAALAINDAMPGAHLGLAEALLAVGDLAEGWEEYEWRYRLPGVPNPMPKADVPHWEGEPIKDGALLLIADQGYGDGIQFARYIPWAAERCAEVVVACSRELQPLVGQMPGIKTLFDQWEACPPVKAYCTLSGLPRLHGTRLDNIPGAVPYLKADPAKAAKWKARLDELSSPARPRIGLVWAGRPTHMNDRNRSAALSTLAPITDIDGVTFISLQKGQGVDQISGYFGRAPLINLGVEIDNFGDSAAIIEHLDLVVTVDTAIGHLTGAMGKPAWIMLPYAPDWRWLRERTDTPWYPDVRLFRPAAPKDWASITSAVAAALHDRYSTAVTPR